MLPQSVLRRWQALPPRSASAISHVASVTAGLLIALIVHYVLYRVGLPSKPFIYVVF